MPIFLKGAYIVYARAMLSRRCGFGYTGEWTKRDFATVANKNDFFEKLGNGFQVEKGKLLANLTEDSTPSEILKKSKS